MIIIITLLILFNDALLCARSKLLCLIFPLFLIEAWASLMARQVKNLSAMSEMQGTQVHSLGWEDSLEKRMSTHSSILAHIVPWKRGACKATVYGVTKSWT